MSEQKRILVVEDDRVNSKLIHKFLDGSGLYLAFAENGHEALSALKTQGLFDLIILDVMMPQMDGFTFLETVREGNLSGIKLEKRSSDF